MATQEVAIKQTVNITLKSDAEVLEEVVVTGYGNFKKSSFTGSASNVSTEKLQDIPTVSVQDRFCLLYTSDAADEEDSVDLGGRRNIKKKKK